MSGYYGGNITFANILTRPSQWGTSSTSLTVIFISLSIAILSVIAVFRPSSDDKIHKLGGFHLVTASTFFTRRYDFFRDHFKKTGVKIFSFRLLQHRVIAMAGEANRKIFFNDATLDIAHGYRILSGRSPRLEDVDIIADEYQDSSADLVKRILLLIRRERINEVLPLLLEDANRTMKEWGTEGKMNPFTEIYDLVFQMTVRMATCRELSEDKEAVTRLGKYFWDVEQNSTPISLLLPWFPTPARKRKQKATTALYTMLLSYVNIRRNDSTRSVDPIDFFISQGFSDDTIIGTIMSIVFAGVINTGVNSCWALLHLGTSPKWKSKAIDECKALVDKYANTMTSDPLHTRLSMIPYNAWEDELPSLDLIVRETLRISISFPALRRNMGKDIQIGEATIKRGDILAYWIADANLSPEIYTNPTIFDPDRYGPGREEDRKQTYSNLSWGAGRHPCAGMKIAKLEIKLLLAMMLLGYEYELVDKNGNYPKVLPKQNRNDLSRSRPIGEPYYIKYKRTAK